MPENCKECQLNKTCESMYGGPACVHREEIAAARKK